MAIDVLAVMDRAAAAMLFERDDHKYHRADIAGWWDRLLIDTNEARAAVAELIEVQKSLISWAESKCPCHDETPDPCPLCDASVAAGTCKAVESIFPPRLLGQLRAAFARVQGEGA